MSRLEEDIAELRLRFGARLTVTVAPSGACLLEVAGYPVEGWSVDTVVVQFVAPVGYPGARPDCFWVKPARLRLANGSTPQAANDANPIPEFGGESTWFSWHLQGWDPNAHTLLSYFRVIEQRLLPAR